MRKRIKTAAAVLGTLAVLAAAALLPYAGIRRADARRLEAVLTRPVTTGQPSPQALADPLVQALYRRGQYYRNGEYIIFSADGSRPAPDWEKPLRELERAACLPDELTSVLGVEADTASLRWDDAGFWQLNSIQQEDSTAHWYLICEPDSGKVVSLSVFWGLEIKAPDVEACLDAYRCYLGLDNLTWQREKAALSQALIYTDITFDHQLDLTVSWQSGEGFSMLTLAAGSHTILEEEASS